MKKILCMLLPAVIMVLCLCACRSIPGDVSKLTIIPKESQLYTQDEINAALEATKAHFKKNYNDCTLKEIYYVGDQELQGWQNWAVDYDADDILVFRSTFDVGPHPDIAMNKNSTYERWKFILAREKGHEWKVVDAGLP